MYSDWKDYQEYRVVAVLRYCWYLLFLQGLGRDLTKKMSKQGSVLLECSRQWFITTGRRPLPVSEKYVLTSIFYHGACPLRHHDKRFQTIYLFCMYMSRKSENSFYSPELMPVTLNNPSY